MTDSKVAHDPLYYLRTEPEAIRAQPSAPPAGDRLDDNVLCDRVIWLCLAAAATLAVLVGSGFGTMRGAAFGLGPGSAAVLGALIASPTAHGARRAAACADSYRLGLLPAILATTILTVQLVPTFQWPLAGAAACISVVVAYSLVAIRHVSTSFWPIVVAWPAGVLLVASFGWSDPRGLSLEFALAGLGAGTIAGIAWAVVGRLLFKAVARGPVLQFLAATPALVLVTTSGLASSPDRLGCVVAIFLVIGGVWWMRAPTARQALGRCIPMIALLNFWGGEAAFSVAAPWLAPSSALAVILQFALIVVAMVRIEIDEATLEPAATYYRIPLVPVPRPDRAFDYPFESYARDVE